MDIHMAVSNDSILGYNLYLNESSSLINYGILANVSYMYNYEGAENEGYYWVDSYDQSLIEFIPPEPQKRGIHLEDGIKKRNVSMNGTLKLI